MEKFSKVVDGKIRNIQSTVYPSKKLSYDLISLNIARSVREITTPQAVVLI